MCAPTCTNLQYMIFQRAGVNLMFTSTSALVQLRRFPRFLSFHLRASAVHFCRCDISFHSKGTALVLLENDSGQSCHKASCPFSYR